jgi:hypothetical protein
MTDRSLPTTDILHLFKEQSRFAETTLNLFGTLDYTITL